jgi:[NiFe] hydrogenase diaphorase moiety large subunit
MQHNVAAILRTYGNNPTRLMDILIDVQCENGFISAEAAGEIARATGLSRVDVEQTISFYHFLSQKPRGRYAIYLNNSVVAEMMGRAAIARAFEKEVGCKFGSVSEDGLIGLYDTACIGMNDQEPAALINGVVFTRLTTFRVREIVRDIRLGRSVDELQVASYGDGKNHSELIRATVYNNIRKKGPVIFSGYESGSALRKLAELTPAQVIETVKASRIRGRGGAGFPTALKWEFCRKTPADVRYIFCNADEGEPGTFKDRVILTEEPRLLFEGMAVAGYAAGAAQGLLYLRFEYRYLRRYLEAVLEDMRREGLLGRDVAGIPGFDFDIRIQMGAGAYVCGEESALIESAEGKRGEPRDRPPFPVEEGYLGKPTVVNNVETVCAAAKVVVHGAEWYRSFGTPDSTGTKVLSISGDCRYPGVYEVEWGFSVHDLLEMVGAENTQAVQVSGPAGACIGPAEFHRVLGYEDLSTGGSIIVFDETRDVLKDVVCNFLDFFIEESCGSCVPCRTMTVLYRKKLDKLLAGHGVAADISDLAQWGAVMKANRCGLGQTAVNPVLSTIKNFRHLYEARVGRNKNYDTTFDLAEAVKESCQFAGRTPTARE